MKAPDPGDFESEFGIDDEDSRSSGASKPQSNQTDSTKTMQEITSRQSGQDIHQTPTSTGESTALSDLPTDVREKLRKLERYESRYHGMLGISNQPMLTLTTARATQILSRCPCKSSDRRAF